MSRPSRLRELKEQAWNAVVRAEGHVQSAHSRLDQLQKAVQGIKGIDPQMQLIALMGQNQTGVRASPQSACWAVQYGTSGMKVANCSLKNGCGVKYPVLESRFLDQYLLKDK